MPSSLNATSSVPPFTDVSVGSRDPTQNRSVPSLRKHATYALLQLWSRARDRGEAKKTYTERLRIKTYRERLIPAARNHPSQTGGNSDHHSSTATAPSVSSPTTTGPRRSGPSTYAQSTGRLAQSHKGQMFSKYKGEL